jgi:excisionase family DNA binding protein
MDDEWITTEEASQISGYHIVHVRRLVQAEKIEAKRFGPVWAIRRSSLDEYLRERAEEGKKRGPKTN